MTLPVQPPLKPMLARLERELPGGDLLYEPKWDGFRCLAFRDGEAVQLQSRHGNDLARYFPELVEALRTPPEPRLVLDGEVVAAAGFAALLGRIHPAASRVERLRAETPVRYVAFDLLARGDRDLRTLPFARRRELLAEALAGADDALAVTQATRDREEAAAWLDRYEGVVAKAADLRYEAGRRAFVKVKLERTVDCVVAGMRTQLDRPGVGSLLLGLYGGDGLLHHVGVASSFAQAERQRLLERLAPLAVGLERHPWRDGYLVAGGTTGRLPGSAGRWTPAMELDWVPLAPETVCEVAYDQLDGSPAGQRFRHPARLVRWRPDREPRSCLLDQLAPTTSPSELLTAR